MTDTICDVCGIEIVDMDDAHFFHDEDCPNHGKFGDNCADCYCDNIAHSECCPECKKSLQQQENES